MDIKSDKEILDFVLLKLEVNTYWFFRQAYLYHETPEEKWFIIWKVQEYRTDGKVPECVRDLCRRIMEDNECLFFRDKGR